MFVESLYYLTRINKVVETHYSTSHHIVLLRSNIKTPHQKHFREYKKTTNISTVEKRANF